MKAVFLVNGVAFLQQQDFCNLCLLCRSLVCEMALEHSRGKCELLNMCGCDFKGGMQYGYR